MSKQENTQNQPSQFKRQKALIVYLGVLFLAAFLLVLLSFLAQLRDNRSTISELAQTSTSALANAQRVLEDNEQLHLELDELQVQLQAERDSHELALKAMEEERIAVEKRVSDLEQALQDQQVTFDHQAEVLAAEKQQVLDELSAYLLLCRAQVETDPEELQLLLAELEPREKLLGEHAMVILQQLKNGGTEEPDAPETEDSEENNQ